MEDLASLSFACDFASSIYCACTSLRVSRSFPLLELDVAGVEPTAIALQTVRTSMCPRRATTSYCLVMPRSKVCCYSSILQRLLFGLSSSAHQAVRRDCASAGMCQQALAQRRLRCQRRFRPRRQRPCQCFTLNRSKT